MTNSQLDTEKVEATNDRGHAKQWGIGRLFLQLDGVKTRLNVKLVFICVGVVFAFVAILTSLRPKPKRMAGVSPIRMEARLGENLAASPTVRVDSYDFSASRASEARPHSAGSGRGSRQLVGGLIVVRRNGDTKIPPGSFVRGRLTLGASNGFTTAVILEPLAPFGEIFLPAGTSLVGAAQSSTERLAVQFTKAVLPDGKVMDIDAVACDGEDKMPGLKGVNVKSQMLSLVGAVGLNFAGGTAMGMQSAKSGTDTPPPSVKDSLLNGASVAALEKGRELSQDLKSEQPIIEVPVSTEFYVLFLGAR